MKIFKSLIVISLILSLSFNIIQYQREQDVHENYSEQEQELKTRIYELEEEQWDYIDENKNLTLDMESYKFIFDSLEENMFEENTQEVLKRTYSFEASICFGDEETSVPQSGIMYITGDSFQFDAKVIKPSVIGNQRVNELLEGFDMSPLHREIYYPLPDVFVLDASSVHLEYNDLEIGDVIKLRPSERFKENFRLDSDSIEIHVVDAKNYAKGSDYLPSEKMTAYYASDDSVHEYVYEYYKFEDNFLYVKSIARGNENEIFYNVSDGAVIYTYTMTGIAAGERSPEYLILPKLILLGYEWESNYASKVITNLDVPVSTLAGDFNCIEVTTYYSNEVVNRSYYSKGMGLIKESNEHNVNELIRVEPNEIQ